MYYKLLVLNSLYAEKLYVYIHIQTFAYILQYVTFANFVISNTFFNKINFFNK